MACSFLTADNLSAFQQLLPGPTVWSLLALVLSSQITCFAGAVHEKYLLDDLESWKSYAGNDSEPARLAPIPPRLQLLQAKPFLLDCALDYIKPPDLSHRIPKEEKKSAIGRLFGWGAR